MAFALTSAYAWVELNSSPIQNIRGDQWIELNITGTTADVDLDIGDLSGTFWSAVDNSTMGAAVLAAVTAAYPQWDAVGCIAIQSVQLLDRQQVLAAGLAANTYAVDINSTTKLPNITFNAADGETSYCIRLKMRLDNSVPGVTWVYTA